MDTPRNFRSAFHGFNREDVVHYLEYINARHASQVNQLTAEAEELRSRPGQTVDEDAQREIKRLQTKCDVLAAQLEAAEAENAELRERLENQEAPAQQLSVSSELDIYRRAEQVEQEARERSELMYFQSRSVLSQATAKVDSAAAEITQKADEAMRQITQLQMAVSGSKQTLQDAAAILNTIRPNK